MDKLGQQVEHGTARPLQSASQHADRFTSSLGSATKQVALATAAFLGFQGVSGAVNAVTGSIIGFDKELRNVDTVLVGSNVSLGQLEQQILRLPPGLGHASELTKGFYQALSAGVEPAKTVGFVAEQAQLASAGLTDLSTTVKVSTAAMDAFGISSDNASHISDVLFTIVQRGKTEFAPLASSISAVFPLAKNLGLSFEDVAATLTTLLKVFPSSAEAVTGFRSVLSDVVSNLDNFRAAGIDAIAILKKDGMTGLMEALGKVTGGSAEVLKAKFIPTVEGSTASLALMGPQLQAQKDNVAAFGNTAGAAATAFAKQQESIAATLDRIKVGFERVVLGGGLTPVFKAMLDPIDQWLTRLVQGGEASVHFAEIATGAVGGVVRSLGLLAVGTTTVIEGWHRMAQGALLATDIMLSAEQQADKFLTSIGLRSKEGADAYQVEIDKMRVKTLLLSASMGDTADRWATTSEALKVGQAAIEASLAKAGQQAVTFAQQMQGVGQAAATTSTQTTQAGVTLLNTINVAQAKTSEAIRTSAQVADAANQAMLHGKQQADAATLASTAKTVSGTITFWQEGKEKVLTLYDQTAQAGTTAAMTAAEAFTKAGISTREVLQQNANTALDTFDVMLKSGKLTPEQIVDEWLKRVDLLNQAGFQTLPPLATDIMNRVRETFRKAGVELPEFLRNAFGEMSTDGKQFALVFEQDIVAGIEAAKQAIERLGEAGQAAGHRTKEGLQEGIAASKQAADEWGTINSRMSDNEKAWKALGASAGDANVQILGFTTAFPTTIKGMVNEIQRLQLSIGMLVGNVQNLHFGLTDWAPFVIKQTGEWRKAIAILTPRLEELRIETLMTAGATRELAEMQIYGAQSARGLAAAYGLLGAESTKSLMQLANEAQTAFFNIQKSGTSSAEHLRDIWVDNVLPTIIDAYGATSQQALAAAAKFGTAAAQVVQQVADTTAQVVTTTVDRVRQTVHAASVELQGLATQVSSGFGATGAGIGGGGTPGNWGMIGDLMTVPPSLVVPGGTPASSPPPLTPLIPMQRQGGSSASSLVAGAPATQSSGAGISITVPLTLNMPLSSTGTSPMSADDLGRHLAQMGQIVAQELVNKLTPRIQEALRRESSRAA